jgi:arabinofuranan 3-O-arabinosyltransferase
MSRELVHVQPPEAEAPPRPFGGVTLSWEAVAYLALGLLGATAVILTDQRWFTPDTKPEVYLAPLRTLARTLSTWDPDPHLGQPNFQAGLLPVSAAVSAIHALGLPAWLVVRVWRALLLLAAGWGAVRLFHLLAGERSSAAGRVTAAAVYVANPYVIVAGATTPILVPYALLPWLLLAFVRSVREPSSWRWPAGFALAFFLMTGMNAGVVAVFMCLALPCYLLYVRLAERTPWRLLVRPTLRCLGLALLVSLYWLVPSAMAGETGEAVAAFTETPANVASTSSYAETLRLLGYWVMYFQQDGKAAIPGAVGYLTNALLLVASFLVPVLAAACALLARARARAFAVILLAVAVPVMVGLFPPTAPSPFGRLLRAAFEDVPGAIAFRTTNKAGALVALAYALLFGFGAAELFRRTSPIPTLAWRAVVAGAAAVVLAVAVMPAWTGGLYPLRYLVPDYWQRLARDVNAGPADSRVLLAPGSSNVAYRWGMEGPDDLNLSLLNRPSVVRSTVPNGSIEQTNFLAAMDIPVSTGSASPDVVAAMARYLGVGDVVVRNDMRWESFGGSRPSQVAASLAGSQSLRLAGGYGKPGEQTVAAVSDFYPPQQAMQDATLPPLQRYAVAGPRPITRTEPVRGAMLVDGDSFAIPSLVRLGLAPGGPAYRLLGSVTPSELAASLAGGARVVVTDTNRRRAWGSFRTGQNYSPTLRADQPLPSSTLTLFGDPEAQTVARLEGARSVSATASGSLLTNTPFGKPELAFDGDRRTAWLTGDFGGAVGQSITLTLDEPVDVGEVVLRPVLSEPGAQIAAVRVRVDAGTVEVPVPAEPEVRVAVPHATTSTVSVEITQVRGAGLNPVGFWEIGVPGVQVRQVVRLPQTLKRLAGQLAPADRSRLDAAPIDVVLTRAAGPGGDRLHDEERVLDRELWLPAERDFTVTGLAAAGPNLPDLVVDRLAGAPSGVRASSSSRFFDAIGARASRALDGDPSSAWVPDGRGPGEWIELELPGDRLDHVDVLQTVPQGATGADVITDAEVSINGGKPFLVGLKQGSTRVSFPARKVERLRLTIAKVAGLGGQVRISEIKAGNARIPNPPPSQRLRGCVEIATIDGEPLEVRLDGTLRQLTAGEGMPLGTCGAPLRLSGGDHQVVSSTGWLVDLLGLSSPAPATRAGQLPPPADLRVTGSSRSGMTIRTGPAGGPYYLVVGQGYDRRWRATMDGRRLGPPLLLDGYSVGWRITDQRPHRFEVTFGPQRAATVAQVVSAAGLVLVALLLFGTRLPRPLRAWRAGRAPAPARAPATTPPGQPDRRPLPAPDSAPSGEPERRPRRLARWRRP